MLHYCSSLCLCSSWPGIAFLSVHSAVSESTVSFVMSVHPDRTVQLQLGGCAWKCNCWFLMKFAHALQFWLKPVNSNRNFTCRATLICDCVGYWCYS